MNHYQTNLISLLRPAFVGLLFSILTLLFGFGAGVVFGLNEDVIKNKLKSSAVEVREVQYRNAYTLATLAVAWVVLSAFWRKEKYTTKG